jgi:hypothetical protein
MTRAELRAAISRRGGFATIAAAAAGGELEPLLATDVSTHVGEVYRRLEAGLDEGSTLAVPLRVTVLVHEEPPERLPALLGHAGLAEFSPIVLAVVGAFGRLWKLRNERDAMDYVKLHRPWLEPLLMFELAHEGVLTGAMRWVARLGGVGQAAERWAGRLESPTLSADLSGRA